MNQSRYTPKGHRTALRIWLPCLKLIATLYLYTTFLIFFLFAVLLGTALLVVNLGILSRAGDIPVFPQLTFFLAASLVGTLGWILIAIATPTPPWFRRTAWTLLCTTAMVSLIAMLCGSFTENPLENSEALRAGAIWILCSALIAIAFLISRCRTQEWRPLYRFVLAHIGPDKRPRRRPPRSPRRHVQDPLLIGEDLERPLAPIYEATEKVDLNVRLSDNAFQIISIFVAALVSAVLSTCIWGPQGLCAGFGIGIVGGMFLSGALIAIRRHRAKRRRKDARQNAMPQDTTRQAPEEEPVIPEEPSAPNENEKHLELLSVFHYVVGGLAACFACLPLFHVAMGIVMASGAIDNAGTLPRVVGLFFILFPGIFVLIGWAFAACVLVAAHRLANRRSWTFCIVVAAIECMFMPFGTVLGVFTIIVLTKNPVKQMFCSDKP